MYMDYKPGDLIQFIDEQFVVAENKGEHGTVIRLVDETIHKFKWSYKGDDCRLVRSGNPEDIALLHRVAEGR